MVLTGLPASLSRGGKDIVVVCSERRQAAANTDAANAANATNAANAANAATSSSAAAGSASEEVCESSGRLVIGGGRVFAYSGGGVCMHVCMYVRVCVRLYSV